MERLETEVTDNRSLEFDFQAPERSGRVVFELHDGRIEIGDAPRVLLDHAELWLERGEHVSLVGPNGTGKTTLIRALTGGHPLAAGKLSTGHNVHVGYLSQHAEEIGAGGDPGQSVLEATQRATGLAPNRARSLLGRFLFSGEEAEKPLAGLSGGELRRLSLAILVSSKSNVLILDEPTNHLDLDSREALEDALRAFPGAILLVTHDRALLDAVGSRTIAVQEGSLRSYSGGWPEYVRVREAIREGAELPQVPRRPAPSEPEPEREAARRSAKSAGPSKNRLRDQERATEEVEQAERALAELEAELAAPEAWATRYEAAKSEARHTAAKIAVEKAYERLESLMG